MKSSAFFLFLSIVLAIYSLCNLYIYLRGYQGLAAFPALRPIYTIIFLFTSLSYIGGRFLERTMFSGSSEILIQIGSFWLAAMLYFFLIVLLLDLLRVINHIIPFYPSYIIREYILVKAVALVLSAGMVSLLLLYGYINARHPRIMRLDLAINKTIPGNPGLHIVFLSDIHLGSLIGKTQFSEIVKKVNELKPDLIILGGDVVDEDLAPVIRQNLGEDLLRLEATLGVIAVTGNHEYIGGAEPAVKYLEEHGLKVLRDTSILTDNRFYIAGREDRDKKRFSGRERKELSEIIHGIDPQLPLIVIDHQPFNLDKAVEAGADLQLSGHTHHGQLWPLSYITKKIYEVSQGYKKKGETHFYVSSGLGTWGPPIRIGTHPEIVDIHLTFSKK